MMKLSHEFVKSVPEILKDRVLYVSMEFATAIHKCCCGCGNEVVTPLSPKDWKLTFDGETISLTPSIGNWSFDCQSHYWITNSRVEWAPKWDGRKSVPSGKKERLRQQRADGKLHRSCLASLFSRKQK
jgi:hypothetical protein